MFALTYKNWLKGLGSPEGAFLKSPLWRIPRVPSHPLYLVLLPRDHMVLELLVELYEVGRPAPDAND